MGHDGTAPPVSLDHRVGADANRLGDSALRLMRELPYARWRDYDTEATVRFYALRLREADMIRSTPQKSSPRAPTGASSTSCGRS